MLSKSDTDPNLQNTESIIPKSPDEIKLNHPVTNSYNFAVRKPRRPLILKKSSPVASHTRSKMKTQPKINLPTLSIDEVDKVTLGLDEELPFSPSDESIEQTDSLTFITKPPRSQTPYPDKFFEKEDNILEELTTTLANKANTCK